MTSNEEASQKPFTAISYEDNVAFSYTLPGEEESQSVERDLTFIWEEGIEKFIEEFGADREYKVHGFNQEKAREIFLEQIEGQN
ncbi:MAG: hypothetical protein Q9M43_08460 [Sulfurimonas sp.]|nr:hypothetical protein [Sulfurimonas sp.]